MSKELDRLLERAYETTISDPERIMDILETLAALKVMQVARESGEQKLNWVRYLKRFAAGYVYEVNKLKEITFGELIFLLYLAPGEPGFWTGELEKESKSLAKFAYPYYLAFVFSDLLILSTANLTVDEFEDIDADKLISMISCTVPKEGSWLNYRNICRQKMKEHSEYSIRELMKKLHEETQAPYRPGCIHPERYARQMESTYWIRYTFLVDGVAKLLHLEEKYSPMEMHEKYSDDW